MERNKISRAILALDPSLTAFGWSVIKSGQVIDFGCIKTEPSGPKLRIRKGDDRMRRVSEIAEILKAVILKHNIVLIVSEQPHGSQSAVAATSLGLVSGLIQGMAVFTDIALEWYNEADCKKTVLGKASATKSEMIDKITLLYSPKLGKVKYINEAVCDSIAVFHTAKQNSPLIKFLV